MADEAIVLLSNDSVKMWEGSSLPPWRKAAEQMLAAHILRTVRFCWPVIKVHIHHFIHLKGPVTGVWSFSANIVFQEILHSRTPWRSRGSLGLITLKVLNRINPHQIHRSQRLVFKSQGGWTQYLHARVAFFFLPSFFLIYNSNAFFFRIPEYQFQVQSSLLCV